MSANGSDRPPRAAAEAFDRERRPDGWARARCEQAFCAMLGAELFGDDGLTGGDASLLELLDLRMIAEEGRAADIAAGRVGAKDKAQRRLPRSGAEFA